MKFRVLWMVGLVLAATAGQVQGQVQADSIPAGLSPGDTYRLVFVTSTTTTATSSQISTYDSIVNAAVDTSSIVSQNSTSWTALVSTPTALGNVHSSVGSYGTSTRLYNTHGQYLGLDTELFFSSPVLYDENGSLTTPAAGKIWTGAIHYAAGGNTAWTLGGADSRSLYAINEAGSQSIAIGFAGKGTSYSIYGISGVQTVAAPTNNPPTSNAGSDQSIRVGDVVFLDGSASYDDNTATALLGYEWLIISQPEGSDAVVDDTSSMMPMFVADAAGTYGLALVVTDEDGLESEPAFMSISSDNLAPTAVATASATLAVVGSVVVFDGANSSDPESDVITYAWEITSAPLGSAAVLMGGETASPSMIPDLPGVYEVSLIVSDFLGPGLPTSVELTATTAEGFAEFLILEVSAQVAALSPDQVTTNGNQTAFGQHLANAIRDLQAGEIADAIDKLNKAIERTDGCPLRGAPDGNGKGRDWIIDCDAQYDIYDALKLAVETLESDQL